MNVFFNACINIHAFNEYACRIRHHKNDIIESILTAYNILRVLTKIKTVMDHSEQQTMEAISLIIPHIHNRLAINIAAYALESRDDLKRERLLRLFERHFQYVEHVDVMAATLTYVTVIFCMGEYELCMAMLDEKEGSLCENIKSWCSCGTDLVMEDPPLLQLNNDDISQHYFMTNFVASCITFLPSEHIIAHTALKLEMVRSKDTIPGLRNELMDFWFGLSVVDGKVYFYFLQYLVYSKLNKPIHKQVAIDNLKRVIGDDRILSHKETAYNLLGWIYKEENRVEEAFQCWRKSWEIRPHHNAAKWHCILLMMKEYDKTACLASVFMTYGVLYNKK